MSRGSKGDAAGAASVTLVAELRTLVTGLLGQRLDRMFDGADDLLFKLSAPMDADERRVYFDVMRIVRLHRAALTRSFFEGITAGFEPGAVIGKKVESRDFTFEELSLCEPQAIEETIAITNMVAKAESLYERPLWELRRRLTWLIQERQAPVSAHILSPELYFHAFCSSTDPLKLEFQMELVIYKLFDRLVAAELGEFYTAILKFFDAHGIKAQALRVARPVAPGGARGAGAPAAAADATSGGNAGAAPALSAGAGPTMAAGGEAMAAGFELPPLDMNTLGTLRMVHGMPMDLPGLPAMGGAPAMAGMPQGNAAGPAMHGLPLQVSQGYSDPDLAAELAQLARGVSLPGWSQQQSYASVQRTGLVGQMFNDILADPVVPDQLKPRFDDLRFGVIKAALKDGEFFEDAQHPVRGLVNELATMAAEARAMGLESLKRIEDVVGRILDQFGEMASAVREASQKSERLPADKIERFLDEQLVQSKARRQALIEKARRVVSEELQLRIAGHYVPASAKALLQTGWIPMMSLRLLRHGMDSPLWRQGMVLLERILHALDRNNRALVEEEHHELFADIEDTWRSVGMPQKQIREELRGYRMALEEVDRLRAPAALAPAPAPAPASSQAPNYGPAVNSLLARLGEADAKRLVTTGRHAPLAAAPAAAAPVAPAPAAAVPPSELDDILKPGCWFKVHDHARKEGRWLKFIARYGQDDERPAYRDSLAFAEFNGKNTVMVKTNQLLRDIAEGLAEPYDQSPKARQVFGGMVGRLRSIAMATRAS